MDLEEEQKSNLVKILFNIVGLGSILKHTAREGEGGRGKKGREQVKKIRRVTGNQCSNVG